MKLFSDRVVYLPKFASGAMKEPDGEPWSNIVFLATMDFRLPPWFVRRFPIELRFPFVNLKSYGIRT